MGAAGAVTLDPAAQDDLARLEAAAAASVARTMAWASQNSGSLELANLAVMRESLAQAFSALPGALRFRELAPLRRPKLSGGVEEVELGRAIEIRVRPEAPLQLALTGHYDTVFSADHPFQAVRREEGALRGPGVADMKGGLSCMLEALTAFERHAVAGAVGYTVLLSPDEEIGSPGSAALLAELGARARFGMIYEPATPDGWLVDARSGSGNFALAVRGRAAHVGRAFAEGRNAVAAAARFAAAIDALNGRRPGVTVNVGAIEGGGPVNVVPERALVRFNLRAPDAAGAEQALAEVRAAVAALGREEGILAELQGGFTRPPKPATPGQRSAAEIVRRAGLALGLDLRFRATGGVCEGNNLAAAGCPNIDTLGVVGGGLHSSEEFALEASFSERAKLSYCTLYGLASGQLPLPERAP